MASALYTLCGQSHGAKQHYMLGIHMHRAMPVLVIVSIHLAFIWANTGSILLALGQDPEISAEAGQNVWLMIPSLFCLWPSSVPKQNFANSRYYISNGVKFWSHYFTPYDYMLDHVICSKLLIFIYIISNILEMWSFEMMVLLSGLLPNPELEASVQ
ncbi:hypothetical protein V8G54_023442 [Vigna mungo]|uniref:Uncharacterized protein n=1 Tax=Vigna mungo TaxID=3915 RepID=A0AAQ3N4Y1_VIGMU